MLVDVSETDIDINVNQMNQPIVTSSRRRNAKDGSPEVELSQPGLMPPVNLLQLRLLSLSCIGIQSRCSDGYTHDVWMPFLDGQYNKEDWI